MNIVFFGSDSFAVPSLKALLNTGQKIPCVITQPDKKKGRHLTLAETPVKTVAKEAGLKIYQPQLVNISEAIKWLKDLAPDLLVVIAYGQILSAEILEIPKIISLNIHASLLPKYRGAAPINWAIIKGEKTTGISIIKMTEKLDAGPIILQKTLEIREDDTSATLEDKLSKNAADSLIDSLEFIRNNNYQLTPQDEGKVSFAPKLKKEDGLIHWHKTAREIHNLVRGILSWPIAFTYYNGKLLKIYKTEVYPQTDISISPGEILEISKNGVNVSTGKDSLMIRELQIEGKRKMTVAEFIAGHRIRMGEMLGKK